MEPKSQEGVTDMSNKGWKPLKLRAVDDKDLIVFTQCIYEAILLPSEISFDKKNNLFAMAIERFTWEIAEGKDHNLMQVLSILIVKGVKEIQKDKTNTKVSEIKSLRSITNIDNNILILLNNEETINLKVKNWSCILEDIREPIWPATAPYHLKNE